ncbi:minichromosome maintenance protein MCM [Candidatus Woesearchaeota archaeon]|nr:minichromosome maintenance protein MCM [Candidatus Woesearchaeota archaeon]
MEVGEQIKVFQEFIEKNYEPQLLESVRKGKEFLLLDFFELAKISPELAEELLENPEEILKAGELAINEFDLPKKIGKFYIRFHNLPESQKILINEIRSKHLNTFLWMEGVVRQKSNVRPHVITAKFECPSCGNILTVLQFEKKFREPSRCGCGRKGKFKELSKELIDGQGLVLEEATEDLDGGMQPKRMNVFLKNDLVSPITDKKTSPGSKIRVMGWVTEVPIDLKSGGKSTKFDLMIEANYIEPVEEDFGSTELTEEELKDIHDLSKDPKIYTKLIKSIAPSIFGYDKIKESLILQLVGGTKKERSDGTVTRGDMHILLIGDPGAGKSQLLKRLTVVAPKGRYVSGKGVSGAGLTASVVRDEFLGGWSLEAGALVLANKGFCMIDELDKMDKEDRAAMHEALEGQTVSISKANIQATLRAETTVLAAANPKFGRFDPYRTVAEQINLPPTLINRFDLIFPIKDLPDVKKDGRMADHILNLHRKPDDITVDIKTKLLKKYIAYARQKIKPALTDGALKEIKEYYIKMRSSGQSEESGIKSIPITARQLEALIRLAEASAKVRLSDKVTKKDAQRAIDLIDFCLSQVAKDMETGIIDIDRISSGIPAKERSKISVVREIIDVLEGEFGKVIPMENVVERAEEKGMKAIDVEDIIEKLRRSGDLFEPRPNFIQKLG